MRLIAIILSLSSLIYIRTVGQSVLSGAHRTAIDSARNELKCVTPDEANPITFNASLLRIDNAGDAIVLVKACIAPGWHLYAYVPSNMPYINTELTLRLPTGVSTKGEWDKSPAIPSSVDKGVMVWENEAYFTATIKIRRGTKGVIRPGLYYQVCNVRQCLPPKEKAFELTL